MNPRPLNRLLMLAALAFGLIATTAATCGKPIVDGGKHCATVAGGEAMNDALPRVNETIGCAIADTSAIPDCMLTGLQALATEFGKDFLMCALEQIASAKFAKPGDIAAGVKQKRAKAYLANPPQAGLCPSRCAPPSVTVAGLCPSFWCISDRDRI